MPPSSFRQNYLKGGGKAKRRPPPGNGVVLRKKRGGGGGVGPAFLDDLKEKWKTGVGNGA